MSNIWGHECPICGVEAEIHDQTIYGSFCNVRNPMMRMIIPVRSWLRTRAKAIREQEGDNA